MKLSSILREFAVLVYFFIFFKGTYVSFPMILYLLFTVGDFGTAQQVFSGIAFVGLIIHFWHPSFKKKTKKLVVNALVFLFLLTPIVQKLFTLPLSRFNYEWFLVPAIAFFLLYLASLLILLKKINKTPKEEKVSSEVVDTDVVMDTKKEGSNPSS